MIVARIPLHPLRPHSRDNDRPALQLLRRPEPRVHQRRALLRILDQAPALVVGIARDSAVREHCVETVERAPPSVECAETAGNKRLILERPTRGDDKPVEVLLAPEVAGTRGRGADRCVADHCAEPRGGRVGHPPVLVCVAGVEQEIDIVGIRIVVRGEVGVPHQAVAEVEVDVPSAGARHDLVPEAFRVLLG